MDGSLFTADEDARLRAGAASLPDWLTPEKAVRRWADLVGEVEAGYALPDYEYINDAGARDLLKDLLRGAPAELQARLREFLSPLDARFVRATRPVDVPVVDYATPDAFWWNRVPLLLNAELERDLRGRGVICRQPGYGGLSPRANAMSSSHARSAARGACVGAILATALHVWMLYATHVSEMPVESVGFLAYFGAVLLGAPTNLLLSLTPVPTRLEYPLLLAGIVGNGALLSWLRSRLRRVPPAAEGAGSR